MFLPYSCTTAGAITYDLCQLDMARHGTHARMLDDGVHDNGISFPEASTKVLPVSSEPCKLVRVLCRLPLSSSS